MGDPQRMASGAGEWAVIMWFIIGTANGIAWFANGDIVNLVVATAGFATSSIIGEIRKTHP